MTAAPLSEAERARAEGLIQSCERDLRRKLSRGEMRDLLMDNTHWRSERIAVVVREVFPERA